MPDLFPYHGVNLASNVWLTYNVAGCKESSGLEFIAILTPNAYIFLSKGDKSVCFRMILHHAHDNASDFIDTILANW